MKVNAGQSLDMAQKSAEMSVQDRLLRASQEGNKSEIRKLSEDFEAIFLELVLKSMRESVEKAGLVDGGNGEEVFRSMLDTEYAKSMAQQHSTGLADTIERQLLEIQGQSAPAPAPQIGLEKYKRQTL